MRTPETSRLFTRWTHPASGVDSLILTERPAPVQQGFYFVTPSMTDDGRFLCLGCGFPPPGERGAPQVLGMVDFERDEMRLYHDTQWTTSRPLLDTTSGDLYWGNDLDLWKRGPVADDQAVRVNRFPRELATGNLDCLATHLTFSPDRKCVNIEARFRNAAGAPTVYIGDAPLDGEPVSIWQTVDAVYNHAQFSPTDPDVQMLAYEYWKDHVDQPFDGQLPYHRMWLIRRGEQLQPILPEPVTHSGHEWWDADGQHVWYVHYGVGVKKVDLATRQEQNLWPGRLSHAYSDRTGRYLVADTMADPHDPDCHVIFRNTVTGNEVEIVNRPPLDARLTQCGHLHPHPCFCCDDRYIYYTTTVHDRVDVALVKVADLIARTSSTGVST